MKTEIEIKFTDIDINGVKQCLPEVRFGDPLPKFLKVD